METVTLSICRWIVAYETGPEGQYRHGRAQLSALDSAVRVQWPTLRPDSEARARLRNEESQPSRQRRPLYSGDDRRRSE
jgi:hypothetical protein